VAVGRTYVLPPFRLAVPHWFDPGSVSTFRSSNRTCRFPGSGSRTRLHAFSRVTPSAVSERLSELLGCPISRSLTASCVGLELRPLPSTGITRLQRYYEPLRRPSAPGLSLTGVRLIILITRRGFPCCKRFPCVHAAATTPVQQMGYSSLKLAAPVSAFPNSTVGSACTSFFSRFARRSLALRPAHSRSHQIRDRYPEASDISSPPCLLRLLPAGANRRVGLAPTGKAPPCHRARGKRSFASTHRGGGVTPIPAIGTGARHY
jgi:hypothetical protein